MSSMFPGGGREETDTRPKSGRDRVLPPLPVEESSESDIYMCELNTHCLLMVKEDTGSNAVWLSLHKMNYKNSYTDLL